MAHLARIHPWQATAIKPPVTVPAPGPAADFSAREWAVIQDARREALWTVRPFGLLRRLWNRAIGRTNPKLANEQLEALRTAAVLSWNYGFNIASEDIQAFLSAGFDISQYELLVSSIRAAKRPPRRRANVEALA